FQAEDGIRDRIVTGVQTCALPISEQGINVKLRLKCKFGKVFLKLTWRNLMNRRSTLYICLSLMMTLSLAGCADNSDVAGIESFGADSWKQYRYSPDSNAVIDSGHDPLE